MSGPQADLLNREMVRYVLVMLLQTFLCLEIYCNSLVHAIAFEEKIMYEEMCYEKISRHANKRKTCSMATMCGKLGLSLTNEISP